MDYMKATLRCYACFSTSVLRCTSATSTTLRLTLQILCLAQGQIIHLSMEPPKITITNKPTMVLIHSRPILP